MRGTNRTRALNRKNRKSLIRGSEEPDGVLGVLFSLIKLSAEKARSKKDIAPCCVRIFCIKLQRKQKAGRKNSAGERPLNRSNGYLSGGGGGGDDNTPALKEQPSELRKHGGIDIKGRMKRHRQAFLADLIITRIEHNYRKTRFLFGDPAADGLSHEGSRPLFGTHLGAYDKGPSALGCPDAPHARSSRRRRCRCCSCEGRRSIFVLSAR